MSHFKPGDIALIVGSPWPDCPNIGKSVELVAFLAPGEEFICPDGDVGGNGSDEPLWLCFAEGLMGRSVFFEAWMDRGGMTLAADRDLMPLRGDFQPEQQKAREVVE